MTASSCYFQLDIIPFWANICSLGYGDKDYFTECLLVLHYSKWITPNNFYRIKI